MKLPFPSRILSISKAPASGFTLIEMVISAALMAMILAAAYLCLSSGLRSQKLIESRADIVQGARIAISMMSADLRGARPLSKDIAFLGMQRMLEDVEADNLDFGTGNYTPKRRGESDFCEVSYFVSPDPNSGQLALWRRRDPTPDDEPLSGGSREEILRGVRGLRFEYYDGLDWYDDWGDPSGKNKAQTSLRLEPNLEGMPEAVRITLSVGSTRDKEKAEPPMVFQTVCRLTLAGLANAAGDSPDESPDTTTPQNQNQPTGATR
jgi:type II secretion system protein J